MRLVDDDQPEPIAHARRPHDRGRVGRDGQRLDAVHVVAEPADRRRGVRLERARPLIEQHARRYEDERGDPERCDRTERGERLARARGQRDHATPIRGAPGLDRRLLVPAQRRMCDRAGERLGRDHVRTRTSASESRTRSSDSEDAGMRQAQSSGIPARTVEDSGRETRLHAVEDEGSTIETDAHAQSAQQPSCRPA